MYQQSGVVNVLVAWGMWQAFHTGSVTPCTTSSASVRIDCLAHDFSFIFILI